MEKNLCRPGFALPLLMALLFAAAPAHAQELGIETVPSQPRALQEFEVRYTAGGEIESIEMPCWGALTLVRELGRTSGTQTSVRDGVMTRSETHAYRYLVRSAVGGELVIPGTTAVVGGQTCRCDGLRVKILPALVSVQPQCRIAYDSVVSRRMGGHILRHRATAGPDRREPLLAVNGEEVGPLMSGYSEKNGLEGFVYHYRVAGDGPGTYSCPAVVVRRPGVRRGTLCRHRKTRFGRRVIRAVVALCAGGCAAGALGRGVRTRPYGRGQQECRRVAVFMARVYAPRPCPALRRVQRRVPVPPVRPGGKTIRVVPGCRCDAFRLLLAGVRGVAALGREVVPLDAGTLCVTPYMGLGMTRRYDMHDFDGVTTSVLVSRGEVYEYRYLLKGGRREVRLFVLPEELRVAFPTAIGACCPDRGERPMDFWLS